MLNTFFEKHPLLASILVSTIIIAGLVVGLTIVIIPAALGMHISPWFLLLYIPISGIIMGTKFYFDDYY